MADGKDKEKSAAKKPAGSVFDVRRPGKAPASPTSRPVISGHKPEAQAAQMAVSGVGESGPILNRRKIEIMPSGDVQAVNTGEPAKEGSATPAPAEPAAGNAPEKEKEALAAVVLDATTGPPSLPEEPKKKDEDTDQKEERSMLFSKPKLTIQPLSGSEAESEGQKPAAEPAKDKAEPEAIPVPEAAESKPEPPEPTAAEEVPAPAATKEPAPAENGQPQPDEAEGQEAQNEPPKPEPHIDPLFDEHGIIIGRHDHHHRHRGLKIFLLLFLTIFLAVVALDVLLDLGTLDLPDIPHTDFL